MSSVRLIVIGMCIFVGVEGRAWGETVELPASKDVTLYQNALGELANGSGDYLFVGRTAQADEDSRRRALLWFDIAGSLPAGSSVESVTLRLNMSRTAASGTDVTLHRVLASWGEGSSDATGEEGAGAPPTSGDATWIHRSYDTIFWSSVGGDFDPVPDAGQTVVGLGFYEWGSNSAMIARVQGWLDNPSSNNGWILVGLEALGNTPKRFDSREHPDPDVRPALLVTYSEPVPAVSSWALSWLGLLMLCAGSILLRQSGSLSDRLC